MPSARTGDRHQAIMSEYNYSGQPSFRCIPCLARSADPHAAADTVRDGMGWVSSGALHKMKKEVTKAGKMVSSDDTFRACVAPQLPLLTTRHLCSLLLSLRAQKRGIRYVGCGYSLANVWVCVRAYTVSVCVCGCVCVSAPRWTRRRARWPSTPSQKLLSRPRASRCARLCMRRDGKCTQLPARVTFRKKESRMLTHESLCCQT